jgi:hypothetical protein
MPAAASPASPASPPRLSRAPPSPAAVAALFAAAASAASRVSHARDHAALHAASVAAAQRMDSHAESSSPSALSSSSSSTLSDALLQRALGDADAASSPAAHALASTRFWETAHRALTASLSAPKSRSSSSSSSSSALPSFTPLERQIVALKRAHADAVVLVEVGYRYRFFGPDAEVAAALLDVVCHAERDRRFLTASVPTYRLAVHLRRLVAAGFKVGVCTQTETAAMHQQSQSESQSQNQSESGGKAAMTFERRVTGATLAHIHILCLVVVCCCCCC